MNRCALPTALTLLPLAAAAAGHLRYENISDAEVQEIQQVVAKLAPGVMINIGSVIEGCGCAEGTACTDQVRVVSQRSSQPFVLLLSKMNGRWDIGPVEKWERDNAELYRRRAEMIGPADSPDYHSHRAAYWERVRQLDEARPRCESAAAPGTR